MDFSFQKNKKLLKSGLRSAIWYGKLKVLQYLESIGIDITRHFEGTDPPLIEAVSGDAISVLAYLLKKGANIDARDQKGRNALMVAADEGKTRSAQILLENGIDINQTNTETGATALISAAAKNKEKMVRLLLEAGADTTIHANNGRTAATTVKGTEYVKFAGLFGTIEPHFTPIVSQDDTVICAYCGQQLAEEIIPDNFCPQCKAHYCPQHYPWTKPRQWHQFEREAGHDVICPNGHYRWKYVD